MTIITVRLFEYEKLKAGLNLGDNIAVFSCDNCARRCDGLGGQQGLDNLSGKLAADGFSVICRRLFPALCSRRHLQAGLDEDGCRNLLPQVDVILPLSCRMGIDRVREFLPNCNVLTITKTLGKGKISPQTSPRLTRPFADIDIAIDDPEGIPIREAARRLGLFVGSY